jgi:hypothetical protein
MGLAACALGGVRQMQLRILNCADCGVPTIAFPAGMYDACQMRRRCAGLRTFLLLVISLTVAAHPLVRALALAHAASMPAAAELIVICTSHGPVVIDEPTGVPQPGKESPSCTWCAVGGGSAAKLPALATGEMAHFELPQLRQHLIAALPSDAPSAPADWPAHAPRGPPGTVSA